MQPMRQKHAHHCYRETTTYPTWNGGGAASVWVYLTQHEGDNSKCSSWAEDCCASNWWGEAQTCADDYVAVKVDDAVYDGWEHCPDYGRYT